jgi:hypothetical protein
MDQEEARSWHLGRGRSWWCQHSLARAPALLPGADLTARPSALLVH